ncbi:choline O-acetyltransferase [Brachionus plicatilis]|uniref:Choline O-acetyltransferase n=1 Tax=Brachionus plicatilis TaxID=10195 RepID=A0A3M7SX75_BRAPC|nr:choline O-acetyltransferase [Brachionus plicatilis]
MSSRILILRKSTLSLIKQSRGIKWFAKPQNYMAQKIPKQDENGECKLPKLEVPDLSSTLNKYLSSLRPILDESDYKRTQLIAKDFLDVNNSTNGHSLQKVLKIKAKCNDNWAGHVYADEYYYKINLPLPIYSNPAKLIKKQNFIDEDSYLKYVTLFINAVLDFKFKIDSNTLETDKSTGCDKTQDLCMDQYKKIFKSYRRPCPGKDKFIVYENDFSKEHIIIISNNQLYKIDLIVNSQLIDELDLFYQLKCIRQESKKEQELKVGLLTSLPRNEWAEIRKNLTKDPENSHSFACIEKSAFIICLDNRIESENFQSEDIKNGNQILNGCGSSFNSANRWFDKTLQFVISEDGVCGLVREHSPSEGPITVNLINHVYDYLENAKSFDFSESYPFSKPEKLKWKQSEYLDSKIKYATEKFDNLIDDFDLNVFCYENFGRSFPKKLKLSPDSFLQVALQYAFFKVNGVLPVHASIGSLRRFEKGRVDYIRGANSYLMNFCKAMIDTNSSGEKKLFFLKQAVDMQTTNMLDAIHGHGYDCHLTALKSIAEQNNKKLPALFTDEVFDYNNRIQLLASQVTTQFEGTFSCFGPNVLGGTTSTYNYKPNEILFTVGGLKSSSFNSVSCLTDAFTQSLDEIFALIKN